MSKYVIGICDDEQHAVEILRKKIEKVIQSIGKTDWEILEFLNPYELIKDIKRIDILFLDIEMPEIDGIKLGEKVKCLNPNCKLIMATSRIDRFKEAFYINAYRFVTKPFFLEEIKEALVSIELCKDAEIEVFRDRIRKTVRESDVSMVKAYNGYVEVIVGETVFRKDVSLKCLEEVLDKKRFFRVNRQFLVNLKYIESWKKNHIIIRGEKIIISHRRQKEFLDIYTEFDLKYRRE